MISYDMYYNYSMYENLPFRGPFTAAETDNCGYYTKIFFPNYRRNILIKELTNLRPHNEIVTNYDIGTFFADVGSTHCFLLSREYGLYRFIPPVQLVWGKNKQGVNRGYVLMKKVIGQDIYHYYNIDNAVATQLDELISISIRMGQDNLDLFFRERRIPDIINGSGFINIMIGTIDSNLQSKPYLVDTYPAKTWSDYEITTWNFAINDLSRRCNGFSFDRTKIALRSFLKSPQLK